MNRPTLLTPVPNQTAATATTLTINAAGVRYAHRRFGRKQNQPPLVFLQRFRGTTDDWDPLFVDTIAAEREVILFDNAGIGFSSGQVPSSNWDMAESAARFIGALGISPVDLLG
jgi:pimeloyl-ACP methyl ester carboxylesterase